MKFNRISMSKITSGVALGVVAMAATAADQPPLPATTLTGGSTSASFTGGATINGGASFLITVPAHDAVDLVATIFPEAGDVGQTGSLVAVLDVPGIGQFNLLSGGIWVPLDINNVMPFATRTLGAREEITVLDGLIGEDTNLTGLTLSAFVGYFTGGDINTLAFTSTPASVTISEPPAAGCPANTSAGSGTFAGKPVCILDGATRLTSNTHLTNNNSYLINGTAFVGENEVIPVGDKVTLTIDSGTTLFAPEGVNTLVVDRGGRIMANGTPGNPIIMTSERDVEGVDALNLRGTWGGLVINGSATLNSQSGTDEGEGSTGEFGGGASPNDDDDSGAVTYVQIRYAGWPITSENELNSIALQGVGRGTILDFVQVHNGADDGIEFFGGTVNAKHLLLTGNDDDALDWTLGYTGKLQHIVIDQTTSGDNCIEADNLGSNNVATPRSIPTISNLTCIGSPTMKSNGHAFELKAGTGMNMFNSVIGGTFPPPNEGCILIADQATFSQSGTSASALNGTLTMEHSLISDACAADLQGSGTFTTEGWFAAQTNSSAGEVDLGGPFGWANGSNINARQVNIPDDSFFDQVGYIGGVKDDTSDWTRGWTFTGFKK